MNRVFVKIIKRKYCVNIIESVDTICRDSTGTQHMIIQKAHKISKTLIYKPLKQCTFHP